MLSKPTSPASKKNMSFTRKRRPAAFKAGLAPVNTNYRYVADELLYLFDNADAEAVVFGASFSETVDAIRGRLNLDEALHTEQTRLNQALSNLDVARQRRAKAIQRAEELQGRMLPLEKQIAEHVLTMNSAQSALDALSSASAEATQEAQKVQER